MSDAPVNKPEKGQSFVELMLVVIFLMLFILGVTEFGTLLNQYLNLVDAAREAARVSSDQDPVAVGITTFLEGTMDNAERVMLPIVLDGSRGDDIIVSYFEVGSDFGTEFVRYPTGSPNGYSRYSNQVTKFTDAEIKSRLDSSAPVRGILLVEIYFNYPQLLKVPVFTAIVPDPIPVYTYAIMPLPKVEP